MSDTVKGLTGIREEARGFVGRRGLKYDETSKGRPRIRFDIACGKSDEENGQYTTWRHCVGYDRVAELLKDIKQGYLVKCQGWVKTEAVLDEYYKPVIDEKGIAVKREYLILFAATISTPENTDSERQLSLAVGQA